ncbi:MAG TPA: TadE/TadG family type IV pilus assembly protein [Gaiellaceae bacterium]|nr:TadE/TadG family type IV pilus assembly protein [Gaiellaceae bacterium]
MRLSPASESRPLFGSRFRSESGAALVEFALVLPLLLTLLLGMLDFGKAFNYWIDSTHLANEGARWAVVNHNPGGGTLQDYVRSQATTGELRDGGTDSVPAGDQAQVCISFPSGTSNVGDPVRVTVTSHYFLLPFIGNKLSAGDLSITGSATMRLEARPTNYSAGCA